MSSASPPTPSVRPKLGRVSEFWTNNKRLIAVVLAGVAGYYVLTDAEFSVPTWWLVGAVFGVMGVLVGWLAGSVVTGWLFDPDWRYLLEVDALEDDVRLWRLTPEKFGRLTVLEGDLKRWNAIAPLYTVQAYDPEWNTAVATWMGSAEDVELLREREKIEEVRERLEEQAQEGLTTRLRASGALRSAVRSVLSGVIARLEGATVDSERELETAVQEAIEEYDVDAELRDARETRESQDLPEVDLDEDGDGSDGVDAETGVETATVETEVADGS